MMRLPCSSWEEGAKRAGLGGVWHLGNQLLELRQQTCSGVFPRVWPGKSRGYSLSAAWSSPAASGGRSAAAPRPRAQAAWPGCALVPHTVSPFPDVEHNHSGG